MLDRKYTGEDCRFLVSVHQKYSLWPREAHALLGGLEALGIGLRAIGRAWAT